MIDIPREEYRRVFSMWLRTGRLPNVRIDGVELKFNPYHDPRNGQFTFAPGSARSLSNIVISDRRQKARLSEAPSSNPPDIPGQSGKVSTPAPASSTAQISDAVYRPGQSQAAIRPIQFLRNAPTARGSNISRFYDPVTLAQVFPGLQSSPGGAIIALADNIFDVSAPSREATAALTANWTNKYINDIQRLDPNYRLESLGFPATLQGQINQLNELRLERAATYLRVKEEVRPLQVETLRFIQRTADRAYDDGIALQRAGRLTPRLSEREALGNFIDRRVREDLREMYRQYGIDAAGSGPVRVNRRENSGSEGRFRRPDARVGLLAFDVTLSQKTLATPQVRGFFNTDFKPSHTIIIRPRQLGPGSTYNQTSGAQTMSEHYRSPYYQRYVPSTFSEIYDTLGSMILGAPTFLDKTGYFPDRDIHTEFAKLVDGLGLVRKKLGEENYAALIDLAARAKALFAGDQEDTNGQTDQGRDLLFEIEDVIQSARRKRVAAKAKDDEGEVTGD